MRREDVEHALDALASDAPAPSADAASLIARGRRRILRQRLTVVGIALAVIATATSVGAVVSNNDTRRVVAPTTTTAPSAVGHARFIAVASSLEAWKCVNPLQHTDDGGRTWQTVAVRGDADVSNCTAIEGGYLWAADGSQIVRVRHMTDVQALPFPHINADEQLTRPLFVDAEHGWIQTYGNDKTQALYRTTDGGTTWSLASTRQGLGQLSFADSEHGASRYGNTVTVTSDGGQTWHTISGPDLPSTFKIAMRGQSIVAWGGSHIAGSQYRTLFALSSDGGKSWTRRNGPSGFERPNVQNTFDAADASHWAVASGRALRFTDDAGRSWQTRPDMPNMSDVGFIMSPTPDDLWVASSTGRILRSTDAGRTWSDVTNGAPSSSGTNTTTPTPSGGQTVVPAQLAFPGRTEGWICGLQVSYSTHDFDPYAEGTKQVSIPPNASAVSGEYPQDRLCAAAPGGNFWMVRDSANESLSEIVHVTIRSTGDETSVSPYNTDPFGRIEALDFVDANHGWALVAYHSVNFRTLYVTEDGGVNWSVLDQEAQIQSSLEFADTMRGWASGYALPTLATTTDGGRRWRTVAVPTPPGATQFTPLVPALVRGNVVIAYGAWGTDTAAELRPFVDVSIDGGRTWSLRSGPEGVTVPGGRATRIFSAADADHWVLGSANRLYVTDDGGRTWTESAQFAGLATITYVARPSAYAMFASGIADALGKSTVVLGTINGGESWRTVDERAPAGPPGDVASFPGGIIGCPTRTLTPAPPSIEIGRAAREYASFRNPTVSAVYRANATEGYYAELFRFNVGSCGPDTLANTWVAYVNGTPNTGPGGSTARVALALAHDGDGWHVFGRYP
jgi:photosystem II stability/assembly factor-like uncharacterized protein